MASRVRNLNVATDSQSLREQADQLLEENDFAAARDLYREAALLELPDQRLLGNLAVAEAEEQLQFTHTLHEKHQVLLTKRGVIGELFARKRYDSVLHECTNLLTQGNLSAVDELFIRHRRFSAAARTVYFPRNVPATVLSEDFWFLWSPFKPSLTERSHQIVLAELAQVNSAGLVPVLQTLAADDRLPPPVQQFLAAKVHELQLLAQLVS